MIGLALGLVAIQSCERVPTSPGGHRLEVEPEYRAEPTVCYWQHGKRAAVSIAFDDARSSHWRLAAPALEECGFRGTFNLNTGAVRDWGPWRALYERGHEIASHTRSHRNMAELSLEQARTEFEGALQDLFGHIPEMRRVVSFAYPYGSSNPEVRELGKRYHLCQRVLDVKSPAAINRRPVDVETLPELKGYGVYPPYDDFTFDGLPEETVRSGGWLIICWHSVAVEPLYRTDVAPYGLFLALLEALRFRLGSLWMATQAEVAEYVLERESQKAELTVLPAGDALRLRLSNVDTG